MKKFFIISIVLIILLTLIATAITAYAMEIPDGAYGVIYIPTLKVKMPIYFSPVNDYDHSQAIIDREESALIYNWGCAYQILDHDFSTGLDGKGEWHIQRVFSGAYAYLWTRNGNYVYECYMTGLASYDGNEYLNDRLLLMPMSSYDIMATTCVGKDPSHHYIAVFRRLREF